MKLTKLETPTPVSFIFKPENLLVTIALGVVSSLLDQLHFILSD